MGEDCWLGLDILKELTRSSCRRLRLKAVETLPISNTWDAHGKPVNHLNKGEVNVVVGYLHKFMPTEQALILDNMLSACKAYDIPVLVVVRSTLSEKAKKVLGDTGPNVHIVSPEELEAQIRKYL
jgi:hypothetical protein